MSTAILSPEATPQDKTVKDFEKILLNYFTGKFDLALAFNSDRVLTSGYDSAGHPRVDAVGASTDDVMTDNLGNVMVLGAGAPSYEVTG